MDYPGRDSETKQTSRKGASIMVTKFINRTRRLLSSNQISTACHVCGKYEVGAVGQLSEDDDFEILQDVKCDACGTTWRDIYKLVGYENLQKQEWV